MEYGRNNSWSKIIIICIFSFFIYNYPSFADRRVNLEDLLKQRNSLTSQRIVVQGEVIGDIIKSAGAWWVNIKDGEYAIGLFSPDKKKFYSIKNRGEYNHLGDIVEVEGVFYNYCPQHQTQDIHVLSLAVIKPGHAIKEVVGERKVFFTALLMIICLTLILFYLIKIRYAERRNSKN